MNERVIKAVEHLNNEGVSVDDLVELVKIHQSQHFPNMSREEIIDALEDVMKKRNVLFAIEVGLFLDKMTASEEMSEYPTLQDALKNDEPLFSIDEYLAQFITRIYGDIATTGYSHLDITKPGAIGRIDTMKNRVFLDDLVGAIATSAGARVASNHEDDKNNVIGTLQETEKRGKFTVIKSQGHTEDGEELFKIRTESGQHYVTTLG